MNRKTFKKTDSLKGDFLDLSYNGDYVILHSGAAAGTGVKIIRTSDKSELLNYIETDNILNDGEMVNNAIHYKFTKYDSDLSRFDIDKFNHGGINTVQVIGNRALVAVNGIVKLWDLTSKKVLTRLDNIDLKEIKPNVDHHHQLPNSMNDIDVWRVKTF